MSHINHTINNHSASQSESNIKAQELKFEEKFGYIYEQERVKFNQEAIKSKRDKSIALLKDVHGEILVMNAQVVDDEVEDDTLFLPDDPTGREFLLDQSQIMNTSKILNLSESMRKMQD